MRERSEGGSAWRKRRWARLVSLAPALLLAGCVPSPEAAELAAPQPAPVALAAAPRPAPVFVPAPPAPPPAELAARRILEARVRQLGQSFNGDVGIAVRDIQTGWTTAFDGDTFFPQQSVSKFWVAITALDKVDRGALDLDQPVTLTRSDLTLFHQPIRELIGPNGYTTTLDNLLFRAMTQSDNTANDFLMRRAGGPEAVRETLTRKALTGIRFGPGERLMQSRLAGIDWRPEYSIGRAFYAARDAVPAAQRRQAFESYISDPIDGATPLGIVSGLARLHRGELLSPQSTRRLLSIMSQTRTGPQRLTGGLAPGWRIAHKTGTGQVLGSTQTGYNDIGIVTAPNGEAYALAVMIRRTSVPIPTRMELMQNVTRAAIAYHDNLSRYGGIASP